MRGKKVEDPEVPVINEKKAFLMTGKINVQTPDNVSQLVQTVQYASLSCVSSVADFLSKPRAKLASTCKKASNSVLIFVTVIISLVA